MTRSRRSIFVLAAASLGAMSLLTACGGSSASTGASAETAAASSAASTEEGVAAGAMGDASFAVGTYMDTIWPIEGNDYADAPSAKSWCATFTSDAEGAVAAVAKYLSVEPDIAAADPASVNTAIHDYLENNCYLIAE